MSQFCSRIVFRQDCLVSGKYSRVVLCGFMLEVWFKKLILKFSTEVLTPPTGYLGSQLVRLVQLECHVNGILVTLQLSNFFVGEVLAFGNQFKILKKICEWRFGKQTCVRVLHISWLKNTNLVELSWHLSNFVLMKGFNWRQKYKQGLIWCY